MNNPPPNNDLPYRLSERHFRRYEPIIKAIVTAWPLPTICDPVLATGQRLSMETYSCRLRDAIKSLDQNQWSSDINIMKFVQIVDDIVVSTVAHAGKVSVGPYESVRKLTPAGEKVEIGSALHSPSQAVPKINLNNPDPELIRAVLLMHHHRIFVEPSTITTHIPISGEGLDIEVDKKDNTYTIY